MKIFTWAFYDAESKQLVCVALVSYTIEGALRRLENHQNNDVQRRIYEHAKQHEPLVCEYEKVMIRGFTVGEDYLCQN